MKYEPELHGSLNDFIRARADAQLLAWLIEKYGDQDFTAWDKYHTWLMGVLSD